MEIKIKYNKGNPPKKRTLLIFLLVFLGIGAIYGGAFLIISPSGELLAIPSSMIADTIFKSFLIPGILLFFSLGIFPLFVSFSLWKGPALKMADYLNFCNDMYWGWTFSIYIVLILIIWLQIQMMIIGTVSWLHTFYMFLALIILIISLSLPVRRYYRKP